jgi:hypothetical protein
VRGRRRETGGYVRRVRVCEISVDKWEYDQWRSSLPLMMFLMILLK